MPRHKDSRKEPKGAKKQPVLETFASRTPTRTTTASKWLCCNRPWVCGWCRPLCLEIKHLFPSPTSASRAAQWFSVATDNKTWYRYWPSRPEVITVGQHFWAALIHFTGHIQSTNVINNRLKKIQCHYFVVVGVSSRERGPLAWGSCPLV